MDFFIDLEIVMVQNKPKPKWSKKVQNSLKLDKNISTWIFELFLVPQIVFNLV